MKQRKPAMITVFVKVLAFACLLLVWNVAISLDEEATSGACTKRPLVAASQFVAAINLLAYRGLKTLLSCRGS